MATTDDKVCKHFICSYKDFCSV